MPDTMTCSVTWDGEVYEVQVPDPATAVIVLEAFLGTRPQLRELLRRQDLGLFKGSLELSPDEQVRPGDDLILRPRVIR
jgi:hypothetical protein